MSIYSTMEITREDALELLNIKEISNEILEEMLFDKYGDKWLNNFSIIDSYDESNWHIKYREKDTR